MPKQAITEAYNTAIQLLQSNDKHAIWCDIFTHCNNNINAAMVMLTGLLMMSISDNEDQEVTDFYKLVLLQI